MRKYITLKEISIEFGRDKANMWRYLIRNGFTFGKERVREANNKICAVLYARDAARARRLLLLDGYLPTRPITLPRRSRKES